MCVSGIVIGSGIVHEDRCDVEVDVQVVSESESERTFSAYFSGESDGFAFGLDFPNDRRGRRYRTCSWMVVMMVTMR